MWAVTASMLPQIFKSADTILKLIHTPAMEITTKILSLSWRNFYRQKFEKSKINVKIQNQQDFNAQKSKLTSWATLVVSLAWTEYAYAHFTQAVHFH